ncbi:MAG: hypothetical protein Q4D96_07440 [Propionibacteriaceae bacterium]|nr:hypothetical protein [Propionibacteriaceae bacterium]
MTTVLYLLEVEAVTPPVVAVGIVFFCLGLLHCRLAWKVYTEPVPRFVTTYNGWASLSLTMPYFAGFSLSMGVGAFKPLLPGIVMTVVALVWLPSIVISLLGAIVWFPRFLLPPWYRRALKAGVPRHDPYAMGAFKALPVEKQKAAVSQRDRR